MQAAKRLALYLGKAGSCYHSNKAAGQRWGHQPFPTCRKKQPPHELDAQGLERIKQAFAKAAQRAEAMGIEAIELHGAHGYLLHQFLSPIANHRTDAYGGNFDNRTRFPMEVFEAVRAVFQRLVGHAHLSLRLGGQRLDA